LEPPEGVRTSYLFMYYQSLKIAIWRGNKSVVGDWLLAAEDIEHKRNAFKAEHVISFKRLAA